MHAFFYACVTYASLFLMVGDMLTLLWLSEEVAGTSCGLPDLVSQLLLLVFPKLI